LKEEENVSGIGDSQVQARVERLERRIKGIMTSPVTNGGMATKERK